jgi:hypothetical protein
MGGPLGGSPGRQKKDHQPMKVIDTPRTNKIGNMVAYISPYGQCYRAYVVPRNPRTEAQMHKRDIFGSSSSGWGLKLTEPQRQRWVQAALTAASHPSLGQYSHLSGQQLCVKINSTLRCVGQPPLDEPPAPVVFGPNPVGDLDIVSDEGGGVRLLLSVGPATEDIMLFGQAPCSAGRMKHRRVNYDEERGSAVGSGSSASGLRRTRPKLSFEEQCLFFSRFERRGGRTCGSPVLQRS